MRKTAARDGVAYRCDRTANEMRSLLDGAHETRSSPTGRAAVGGWIALGATILFAVGCALQTLVNHVSVPARVAELVFFGVTCVVLAQTAHSLWDWM